MAELHRLAANDQILLSYIDPLDNDLLPINNDDNFGRALKTAKPLLRLIVQRKGKYWVGRSWVEDRQKQNSGRMYDVMAIKQCGND